MPPDTQVLTLAAILTAGGAVVGAGLIAGLIGLAKNIPSLGAWIDAGREPAVAYLLAAVLVALAYASSLVAGSALSIEGGFAAFLAWYGIARLSNAVHDDVSGLRNRGG